MTMDILKAIGYCGKLAFEAYHQCPEAPEGERDTILKELYPGAERVREYALGKI